MLETNTVRTELHRRWNFFIGQVAPEVNPLTNIAFTNLYARYSEQGRFYHTPVHILDCLHQLDEIRSSLADPLSVEAGLLGHDVIYDTRSHGNEAKSADYMYDILVSLGATPAFGERTKRIILATDHLATPPVTLDEMTAVDIDLSILGRDAETFDEYDRNIRKEYAWVPSGTYKEKREEVLGVFLNRGAIFHTTHFRNKYEQQARTNLERALTML